MKKLQDSMKAYKSSSRPEIGAFADFWALADFWKHYYPFLPLPEAFSKQRVRDFKVGLGLGEYSGPVLHDLIIPVYNGAIGIAERFAAQPDISLPPEYVPSRLRLCYTAY